jgi:hypothetical protein
MKIIALLIAAAFLSIACFGKTKPNVRRAAANVQLLSAEQLATKQYRMLNEINSESCLQRGGSMAAAREGLKPAATSVGANAVINILCEERSTGWCWQAVVCTGDAVQLQ